MHTAVLWLAMVSYPTFDPNRLSDSDYVNALMNCDGSVQCAAPFVNKATQGCLLLVRPGNSLRSCSFRKWASHSKDVFDFGALAHDTYGPYYTYEVGGPGGPSDYGS